MPSDVHAEHVFLDLDKERALGHGSYVRPGSRIGDLPAMGQASKALTQNRQCNDKPDRITNPELHIIDTPVISICW